MTPGIHLLHKPVGPTSFSIVQEVLRGAVERPGKRPLRGCHGGTLDPFASGLLLILVEPATKLFEYLHAIPKVYEGTIRWGMETDNGDPLGKVIATGDASGLTARQIEQAMATFVGWQEQVPPATSNKRIGGERAYEKAHRGEDVEMPAARVYLHEATFISHDLPRQSRVRISVRGGYYVRSLARDLGRTLGCCAHLSQLHRTAIGPWVDPGEGAAVEVHGRGLLAWAESRILSDQEMGDLRQGKSIGAAPLLPPDWNLPERFPDPQAPVRGFHQGRLCYLLRREGGQLKVLSPLGRGL